MRPIAEASALPEINRGPQYADFAAWERERLRPDGPRYRDQLEWWRRAFGPEWPALRLPFSRAEPVPDAPETDGAIDWRIEPGEAAALDELARRAGTTSFVVRLAAFAAQLGLETGQEQIALGTYAMNRPLAETQSMFGFFSNPIAAGNALRPEAVLPALAGARAGGGHRDEGAQRDPL